MKITVIIEDITLEVDMPYAKASAYNDNAEHKGAITLIKTACAEAIELYKAKRA